MTEQQRIGMPSDNVDRPVRIVPYARARPTPRSEPTETPHDDAGLTPRGSPGALSRQVATLEAEVDRLRQAESALLESNDALTLLSETANELLSSDKPQQVINTLFEKLSARLGLEAYFNYLVVPEKGRLLLNSYAGIPQEVAREIEWLDYGQAVCGCVARDGCRIVAEDIQNSTDIRTDLVRSFGITAYACHPLLARDRVIGTFSFGTSRKPCFEPHELALMQAVCDQVSMAMERILLISELRRHEAAQRFLAEAGALLASSLDYEETLSAVAQLAAGPIADWCIVDLAENGDTITRLAVAHAVPEAGEAASQLRDYRLLPPDRGSAMLRAIQTGDSELYSEVSETKVATLSGKGRERATLARLGILSAMVVPLRGREKTLGAMTFLSTRPERRYGSEDLTLAEELAHRVALSIEAALLYHRAREAVRVRDEFLSAAAHELKTPITSLRGFAQVVLRQHQKEGEPNRERTERAMQVIDQQSQKLAILVSQLLDISRIESGQLAVDRKRVEMGRLAGEVMEAFRVLSPHHQLALRVHEHVWALVDPVRLEQVLRNLLDNAVKFSPTDSRIDVDVWSPQAGIVKLAVRDRGPGIPPERRERMFDRFYQAHSEGRSGGMGLGLHIARHIVDLHGGNIDVDFPPDGGTRFVISLPTAPAELAYVPMVQLQPEPAKPSHQEESGASAGRG